MCWNQLNQCKTLSLKHKSWFYWHLITIKTLYLGSKPSLSVTVRPFIPITVFLIIREFYTGDLINVERLFCIDLLICPFLRMERNSIFTWNFNNKMYAYINSRLETRQKVFKCWYLSGFWSRFLEFIDKAFELK